MPATKIAAALALCLVLGTVAAHANIVKLEITKVEPAGPTHERITGKAYGELDPGGPEERGHHRHRARAAKRARQSRIRHHVHAREADGHDDGERRAPLHRRESRRRQRRCRIRDGHVTLVSGWQGDVVPTATNSHHSGACREESRRLEHYRTAAAAIHESDRQHDSAGRFPAASLRRIRLHRSIRRRRRLISATGETATGAKKGAVTIPSTDWAFADCSTTPFPGKPDPGRICVKNGFDPALLYELQYTVKDPLVLGIGLAATRDLGAFFRYETADAAGTPNPVAGRITHAISEGSSQSGTFLRLSLLLGFNQDERGRIVWDGMNPHIAARFTDLNRRFAFPGGLVSPFELGHEGPAWWTPWEDTGAQAPRREPARSLPRHEHVPEDRRDIRICGNLGTASVVHARRHDREEGHPAAGERAPLLLPGRLAWRRPRRVRHVHQSREGRRDVRAADEPGAGPLRCARRSSRGSSRG